MKNISLLVVVIFFCLSGIAQTGESESRENKNEGSGGFQKDRLFTGGGLQLSYANYNFLVGLSPVLGYSFNNWLDAGIGVNFIYNSARILYVNPYDPYTYYVSDDKARATLLGPMLFAKAYPIKFLFLQAQLENNFIFERNIFADGAPTEKKQYNVSSLLLGVGYCYGREEKGEPFYYVSISLDVFNNRNSPYSAITTTGNTVMEPVIRAGLQIPLFQGKRR